MRKSDGVRLRHKKSDEVRVDHEKRSDGLTVDHEIKMEEVRVHHKKERWGKS